MRKPEVDKVAFEAMIKKFEVMTLASCDKGARLTLLIDNPGDELVDAMNRLFKADASIAVALAAIKP
jgi:hypothetical protein